MSKFKTRLLAAFLSVVCVFPLFACGSNSENVEVTQPTDTEFTIKGDKFSVSSPDGRTKVELTLDANGELYYKAIKSDVEVVKYSKLGMQLDRADLSYSLEAVKSVTSDIYYDYDNISGRNAHVSGAGKQLVLTLKNDGYLIDVTVRAYNDGYAFRYDVRSEAGAETATVVAENSEFALPERSDLWVMRYVANTTANYSSLHNYYSYEENYYENGASQLGDTYYSMPMMFRAGNSDTYALVTESALIGSGFYGSFLQEQPVNRGFGVLQTVMSPAGADGDTTISLPFTSPWRVCICGSLKECVESELTEAVYGNVEYWKPDDYDDLSPEEQKVFDYDWVEPGIASWDWFDNTEQSDYETHEEYLDLAVEMGWKYIVLDAGWQHQKGWLQTGTLVNADLAEFSEFAAKAHERGIKVIGWMHGTRDFRTREAMRATLTKLHKHGLDGIKPDFFDYDEYETHQGEDKANIEWYETLYQECARLEMVVLCHGANKPTGERRVYPNVIGREAVKGAEFSGAVASFSVVNSMFTRALVGPTDFTPVVRPIAHNLALTAGQCMALSVLYESGIGIMADTPETYLDEHYKDFYSTLPAARDKTVFLGGEPERYFCAAVKSGDVWYVAGISGARSSVVKFDYSFLGEGTWKATVFTDADDKNETERTEKTVTSADSDLYSLKTSGGFAVKLVKN